MEYIIQTHNLQKKYKNYEAVSQLNMNLTKGEIYGLIGKNGAGKTSLIRLICGLQKPTNGTYSIYEINNTSNKIVGARKKMGAIVEQPSIYYNMTAKQNLLEQCKVIGISHKNIIEELLGIVNLLDVKNKMVRKFSLGMKQRLGIAIALLGNPELLILDEPLNGLDPEGIIEIRELILKLNKEKGITFLISSHYLDELSKVATCYGFMNKGKLVKEITKEELENECKKRIEIKVDNVTECEKYLKEFKIPYEVISNNIVNIYDSVNVSNLVKGLSERNCEIEEFHEKDESLENYYMNLIGGDSNA